MTAMDKYFVVEPGGEREDFARICRDALRCGQARRMLFEPLDAEQLLAHRSDSVPWRRRSAKMPDRPAQGP